MFKTIWLMRRKPGMSKADFIAYYENAHRLIGEKVLAGAATRYVRRFLHAFPEQAEPVYDVLMEIWFPSAEAHQAWLAGISEDQATRDLIAADEERFFDRPSMVHYYVEEHESNLGAQPGA